MGLFGGSSSKSYSTTIMEDHRVIAEEAEIMAGAGSAVTISYPESVAVAPQAVVGDIVIQPYSPGVQQTISELIETVQLVSRETIPVLVSTFGDAISLTSEAGMRATDILGEKLQQTQLGQAAILPGIAKYLLIAVGAILIAGKVWK
ncbi:hypothetical protein LCGC14_0840730 [marine sediment metagenome]|uniref:Uncharacterized protein n=1 Tax=marine sediment metagenome TaxID=412755 RepID=A0A0F9PDB1_9ZZZZ